MSPITSYILALLLASTSALALPAVYNPASFQEEFRASLHSSKFDKRGRPVYGSSDFQDAFRDELKSHRFDRRDDQGLTSGWSDLSGTAKAGVVLAPTLAAAFVLLAAFWVWQEKRAQKGEKGPVLPKFGKGGKGHKKRDSNLPGKRPEATHKPPTLATA